MPRVLVATAVIGGLLAVAQPVAAQGWSERVLGTASAWASWASSAVSTEMPSWGEATSAIDQTITSAKAYAPTVATDVASQASSLYGQAVVLAKSYGPGFPTLEPDASKDPVEWSDTVKQSMGCLVSGSIGTVAAMLAGGENLVNVIAGGVVTASNPIVLYTGLFGVVFASFCAIGQALTPLYIQYYSEPTEIGTGPHPVQPTRPAVLPDARAFYIVHPITGVSY